MPEIKIRSLDSLALILENCHSARFAPLPYGVVMAFRVVKENNEQQIELQQHIFDALRERYSDAVNKWIGENNE